MARKKVEPPATTVTAAAPAVDVPEVTAVDVPEVPAVDVPEVPAVDVPEVTPVVQGLGTDLNVPVQERTVQGTDLGGGITREDY